MHIQAPQLPIWEVLVGVQTRVTISGSNTAFGGSVTVDYTVPAGKKYYIFQIEGYNIRTDAASTVPQAFYNILYDVTNAAFLFQFGGSHGEGRSLNQPIVIKAGVTIRLTSYQYGVAVNFHGIAVFGYLI